MKILTMFQFILLYFFFYIYTYDEINLCMLKEKE